MQKNPEIIKRELVYKGKAFSVFNYTCRVGADVIERDIIERAHGVVVVPIFSDGSVLLIREYCAGSNSFILSLPGGSLEENQDPQSGALRELREETGFTAKQLIKLRYAYTHPSMLNRKSFTFLGYDLEPDPLQQFDEIIEVVRLPLDEAIDHVYKDFDSDVSTIGNLLMARQKLTAMGII